MGRKVVNHYQPFGLVEKLIVLVDVGKFFENDAALCEFLGKPQKFLNNLRSHIDYINLKEKHEAKKETVVEDETLSPEEYLNAQINKSLKALVDIRDNANSKDSDRLKAIQEILSRAKEAPRPEQRAEEQPKIILQIPFSQVETIRKVAAEEGEQDLIEMLEGSDFSVDDNSDQDDEFEDED